VDVSFAEHWVILADLSPAVGGVIIRRHPAAAAAATVVDDGQVSTLGRAWNRPRERNLVDLLP
jgi:hypothetical protein